MLFFFISADIQVYADYKGQKMSKAIFLVVSSSKKIMNEKLSNTALASGMGKIQNNKGSI